MSLRALLLRFLSLAGLLLAAAGPAAALCAGDPAPCTVSGGTYHIALPPQEARGEGPVPALLWLHGAGGHGVSVVENAGMRDRWLARGWAVIGADGMERPGRFGTGWSFHPDRPKQRDEIAFLKSVADDAAARFGIDRDRVLLAGFSIGGSMTSYAACAEPGAFAAYAPVAGAFWRPHPEGCAGPVRLFHTHGWSDTVVPLEGRPLGGGRIYQGDVFHSLLLWREANGCDQLRPDAFDTEGRFWRRRWTDCAPGTALELALHTGGHAVPLGWSAMILDWWDGMAAEGLVPGG